MTGSKYLRIYVGIDNEIMAECDRCWHGHNYHDGVDLKDILNDWSDHVCEERK